MAEMQRRFFGEFAADMKSGKLKFLVTKGWNYFKVAIFRDIRKIYWNQSANKSPLTQSQEFNIRCINSL